MCFLTSQDMLACICILYLANQYSMHVALVVYPCLADAIFFEWWSTSALAFDLLDFITWRVSLLPHATTSTMQMARIRTGSACKSKMRWRNLVTNENVARELTADQLNSDPVDTD